MKVFVCPKGHRKSDLVDGVAAAPVTILWKGARVKSSTHLDNPIWLKVFKNRIFRELPPSTRTRLSFTSLTMGLTIRGYRPDFWMKSRWSLRSKVMEISDHFRYSRVVGETAMISRAVSFCFRALDLRATIDLVDLHVSLGEIFLWIFGLLFLISLFGRLEDLISKALQSVAVPSLVLSLGVENTYLI
jgi:hypothetical protein